MTYTKIYPTEPADIAAAVVDAIDIDRRAFNMGTWCRLPEGEKELLPEFRPSCGTALCAAAWTVHCAGYTLVRGEAEAMKDGVLYNVPDLAADLLHIPRGTYLWYECEEAAYDELKRIAGRR